MSADEFDPFVERLFSRAPHMADAPLFEAQVQARMARSSRVRRFALGTAGLVGGLIAVRELLNVDLNLNGSSVSASAEAGRGLSAAGLDLQAMAQSVVDRAGLSDFALGSMGGMQLFWITAGALAALLAAGAVKLSQEL